MILQFIGHIAQYEINLKKWKLSWMSSYCDDKQEQEKLNPHTQKKPNPTFIFIIRGG